jgi:hypothetical protein
MDIKSKILAEVEKLGSGYVQMMHDAFNECSTLRNAILIAELSAITDGFVVSESKDAINSKSNGKVCRQCGGRGSFKVALKVEVECFACKGSGKV